MTFRSWEELPDQWKASRRSSGRSRGLAVCGKKNEGQCRCHAGLPRSAQVPPQSTRLEIRRHLSTTEGAQERLQLTWINSHLPLDTFCEKFGPQNWWRWKANQLVDELVQHAANHQRDHNWEQKVIIQDEVTLRINAFLADRVQKLFQYGTGEGPLVSFQEKPEAQGQPNPGGKKKPGPKVKQSLKTKGRRTKTGEKPVKTPSSEGPNKRQQLEALLAGQKSELGHDWRAGHRSRTTFVSTALGVVISLNRSILRPSLPRKSAIRVSGWNRLPLAWVNMPRTKW